MAATNSNTVGASSPVSTITTNDLGFSPANPMNPDTNTLPIANDSPEATGGVGVEGETDVWVARYSKRNFLGRFVARTLLTAAWAYLAYYSWVAGHLNLNVPTWIATVIVSALWVTLIYRVIQGHYGHYYRLTNRRLFVSSGILRRRRDMMELLRIKDVFTSQQSLLERWLSLGTVVVVPTEKELPTFYLIGVSQPKQIMDMIWHHARTERDLRSVKVDSV